MSPSSWRPSIPVASAYGLLITFSTALCVRPVVAAASLDPTPMALLAGPPSVHPSAVLAGGLGLALLLAAVVIGLALLTARAA